MVQSAGGLRTVPQIFIHGRHVGGYDELAALEREGKLNNWLANMLEMSSLGEVADASEP
jgi:glutaredoxin 3